MPTRARSKKLEVKPVPLDRDLPRDVSPCSTLRLILGDQLNQSHSWFQASPNPDILFVIIESPVEATYVRHHVQKILSFFLAMRFFACALKQRGHRVRYLSLNDANNKGSITATISELLIKHNARSFEYQLPDEYRLDQELGDFTSSLSISHTCVDTEHFYTTRQVVSSLFRGKKQFLMETFYRHMRREHNVLMDGREPLGGQWNFDSDNRQKLRDPSIVPEPCAYPRDVGAILQLLGEANIDTLGSVDARAFSWPVTREECLDSLDHFCKYRLPSFGSYQDAMHSDEEVLFHSQLSFALNAKLLSPKDVVTRAVDEWSANEEAIELHQIEGFVRQILGWREYMRGLYWHLMPDFADMNFFGHSRPLPSFYWTGKTQMNCVKHAVEQSLNTGYAHHIQRLMVTGNFALLSGVDPAAVDAWYLGIYVDAIQWVQLPNTRGMSQYADGGIVASKPYISGGNYLNKMSNYCGNCVYDIKKRHGERSCPFNSLYWNFLDRHQEKLRGNSRMAMPLRTLEKFSKAELDKIRKQAQDYIDGVEEL